MVTLLAEKKVILRPIFDVLSSNYVNTSQDTYKNIISPYKGELEEWYFYRQCLWIYLSFILINLYVVLVPRSRIIWLFRTLPKPSDDLRRLLNNPG